MVTPVVFDIGKVLIDFDPVAAFAPELGGRDRADAFLARIAFARRNLRGDAGTPFATLAAELDDAADRALLARYPELFPRAIARPIEGSFALIERLRARGHPVHAITKFSAETWPAALRLHPRLGEVFDVTLVSGQLGIVKPDRRIFDRLTERTGARPEACLFIDDNAANVAGARAAGWQAHLFKGPARLERALVAEGLL